MNVPPSPLQSPYPRLGSGKVSLADFERLHSGFTNMSRSFVAMMVGRFISASYTIFYYSNHAEYLASHSFTAPLAWIVFWAIYFFSCLCGAMYVKARNFNPYVGFFVTAIIMATIWGYSYAFPHGRRTELSSVLSVVIPLDSLLMFLAACISLTTILSERYGLKYRFNGYQKVEVEQVKQILKEGELPS